MARNLAKRIMRSIWFYAGIRILGTGFLFSYLVITDDMRFSIIGSFAYLAIAIVTSYMVVTISGWNPSVLDRLNKYWAAPAMDGGGTSNANSGSSEVHVKAQYLSNQFRDLAILFVPAEDALICVPVLIAGVTPLTAILGGDGFRLDASWQLHLYGMYCERGVLRSDIADSATKRIIFSYCRTPNGRWNWVPHREASHAISPSRLCKTIEQQKWKLWLSGVLLAIAAVGFFLPDRVGQLFDVPGVGIESQYGGRTR